MAAMAAGQSADASQNDPDVQPIFGAIEQQRAHEHVAEQLRRQIGVGIIAPGDALPPERELARLFGVGGVRIQLGIGMLEADRLITTRRGRSGASFVLAPAEQHGTLDFRVLEVAQSADLIREAIDFREVIEPAAAHAAARSRTKRELAAISSAAERMAAASTDAEFMREDTAFHLAIARAASGHCSNRLMPRPPRHASAPSRDQFLSQGLHSGGTAQLRCLDRAATPMLTFMDRHQVHSEVSGRRTRLTFGAIMAAKIVSPDRSELIGYPGRWCVAPGGRIQVMASSAPSPITVRLVRLGQGAPNPAGPGLRTEPVASPVEGEYRCGPQTTRSGSFAVLDAAPAEGSVLSVWAWTRLPARGRRQVLLARGHLELFLDAEGLPSISFGEVCLSARQPLRRESWTRLGVSFPDGRVGPHVARELDTTQPPLLSPPVGAV